jgi:hypothetical protein
MKQADDFQCFLGCVSSIVVLVFVMNLMTVAFDLLGHRCSPMYAPIKRLPPFSYVTHHKKLPVAKSRLFVCGIRSPPFFVGGSEDNTHVYVTYLDIYT